MTSSIGSFDAAQRRQGAMAKGWTALKWVLTWPGRVYRARRVMMQLGRLGEHELRDIGLTRLDLHDATALALDSDPSLALRRRIEERRRRR